MNILRVEELTKSPWIRPRRVIYENDSGDVLQWDYIERKDSRSAVLIIPRFRESGDIIFTRQYRVIFDRHVIGFPAGVLTDSEDVETCALRELQEETGYRGKILRISPELTLNSALVKETAYCVVVELQEDALPEDQKLEPAEQIEVYRVRKDEVGAFFEWAAQRGDIIGAGPWYMVVATQFLTAS